VTERTQQYANHRHRPILWQVTMLVSAVAFGMGAIDAARARFDSPALVVLLLSIALMLAVFMVRNYALTLQNRIIRMEMAVRLARIGRSVDTPRLSLQQVIALRFASDAELPALMDRAIAEQMTPDQIKRAVTSWQGDYLRT
jgi:hypothetical protein